MRQFRARYIRGKLSGKNGQALAELGVFASIFLLCLASLVQYGLQANFQQEERMVAFRKALNLAANGSGNARQGQAITFRNRMMPNAQDDIAVVNRYPVGANSTVQWTNAALGQIQPDNPDDLPRLMYVLEGQERIYAIAGVKTNNYNANGTMLVKKDNPDGTWRWDTIALRWGERARKWEGSGGFIIWEEDTDNPKPIVGYMTKADFDNDGKEEAILTTTGAGYTETTDAEGKPYRTNYIKEIRYLDFQEGQLDLTINSADEAAGRKKQGLQRGYTKSINFGATKTNKENQGADNILTTERISGQEAIAYKFVTNAGEETINQPFIIDKDWQWTTPNF